MPFLTLPDQRLHYSEHRDDPQHRPALVLLHGAGGNLFHWPPGLRRLVGRDVYALDLPGHGRSPGPGRDAIVGYAEVVEAWAQALELPPFVLAGHSLGGAVALTCALRHPERLAGLILAATGARLRVHPDILGAARGHMAEVGARLVEWVHGPRATPAEKRQYLRHLLAVDTEVMYGDWLACDRFDVRQQLAAIDTPTLILAGVQDIMTPPLYASFMAERIPGADLTWIESAGHMLMLEQPALVAGAITGFLDRLGRG